MIICKSGVPLVESGLMKIVARDEHSITVCVTSINKQTGDEEMHDVVLSWNEVFHLHAAANSKRGKSWSPSQ